MSQDKPSADLLAVLLVVLGLQDTEILEKLAILDGRSLVEELRYLTRGRAFGRLKDLGDDRALPQVRIEDLSDFVPVKSLHLEQKIHGSGDADQPSRAVRTPK